MQATQECARCHEHLPADAYHPSKRGKPGNYCRDCCAQYKRHWHLRTGRAPLSQYLAPQPKQTKPPRPLSLTYRAVHKRIAKTLGPASLMKCARCDSSAAHWSYDHRDPNEISGRYASARGARDGVWSLDPAHYTPLCRRCHTHEDGNGSGIPSAPQSKTVTDW